MAFPALIPSSRLWSPGDRPTEAHAASTGAEARVRLGSVEVDGRLQLTFIGVNQSEMLAIDAHVEEVGINWQTFTLPGSVFDGLTQSDFLPAGYGWIYLEAPEVQDYPCGGHIVAVSFGIVPVDGVAAPGAEIATRWAIRTAAPVIARGASLTTEWLIRPGEGLPKPGIVAPGATLTTTWAIAGGSATNDPYQTSNKLLLTFVGANNSTTIIDSSPLAHTVTANGNAVISTAESISGGSSLYLDGGSTTYLTIPASSAFAFSTAFTLEGWLYLPATPSGHYAAIFDSRNSQQENNDAITLVVDSNRKLKLYRGPSADLQSSANAIPLTTWTHFAACWDGTTLSLYAAGSQLATVSDSVNRTKTGPVRIGRVYDDHHAALNCYLSYMRLTAASRYSGSSYTVPSLPLY